jgi:hypothetical protein
MRTPAAPASDASVASPKASGGGGLERQGQYPFRRKLRRRSLVGALCEAAGALPPEDETTWNFTGMAADAQLKEDDPDDPERILAEAIAKAMHYRPLMSRLERSGAASAELPEAPAMQPAAATVLPPPIPADPGPASASTLPPGAAMAQIDEFLDEGEEAWTSPPSSAEWLGKARRERNRARLRNAAGWLATLAIGGTIIATAMLMLPR